MFTIVDYFSNCIYNGLSNPFEPSVEPVENTLIEEIKNETEPNDENTLVSTAPNLDGSPHIQEIRQEIIMEELLLYLLQFLNQDLFKTTSWDKILMDLMEWKDLLQQFLIKRFHPNKTIPTIISQEVVDNYLNGELEFNQVN